jgi:ActR/RegA family two-component response regulator
LRSRIILVIEDDPLLAAGLARVLDRRGNAVNRAAVGSRRQPDRQTLADQKIVLSFAGFRHDLQDIPRVRRS